MIPAQQGFADLLPKSPGMKMILGLGAAFAGLLTCFACAFIAMPSQGAATATATPATGTVTETSTLTATAVITGTPVITVTPILSTTVPSASPTVTPPSTLPCTIVSGVVFNDLNANRARDQSEPGLAGAAIQLQNPAGGVAAGAVSDSNGAYQVGNFPLGAYRLVVAAPPGFVATTPSEMPLNLFGCSGFTDLNFGFTQPAPPTTGPSPTTVIVVVTPPPPPPAPTTQVVPTTAPPPTVNVPTVPVVTAAPPPTSTFTPTPTPTPSPTPTLVVTAASAEVAWTDGPDVEFKGTISATGEGIVIYQWEHNDGSTSPPQTLTFLNSGTLQVAPEDLWQDNGKCVSSGWARVQVLSPNARTSDPASFQVKCDTSVPAIASPAATLNPNP